MTKRVKTDPSKTESYRINAYILYAALSKKPVFEAYKSLCKLEESKKIDYVDFEWRYYQFYNGNRDLTIERSAKNSSPLTLSDLPLHVLEKVVGGVPVLSCMTLRKVSKNLKNLAESSGGFCKNLEFKFYESSAGMTIDNLSKSYGGEEDDDDWDECSHGYDRRYRRRKDEMDYDDITEALIDNASKVLKNPKLHIDLLKIGDPNNFYPEFLKFLQSLNFQLNVRSVIISEQNQIIPILTLLKPGTLKSISFHAENLTDEQFEEIAQMEQWKGAKELVWRGSHKKIPMEQMLHFEKLDISRFHVTEENLVMLRDVLLKSEHLKSCDLPIWSVDRNENQKRVNTILSEGTAYNSRSRKFAIPNSRDYFQLKFGKDIRGYFNSLTITRMTEK